MSTLVLELRQGDMMVVNGAPIRFRNRVRIELAARARFLFGKQIMPPEAAVTPARRRTPSCCSVRCSRYRTTSGSRTSRRSRRRSATDQKLETFSTNSW